MDYIQTEAMDTAQTSTPCSASWKCYVARQKRHSHTQLPSAVSTVNPQIRTRHERACVAEQEDCRTTVFPRLTELTEHVMRRPFTFPLRKLLKQCLDHSSNDVTRRNSVDADTMWAPLRSKVTSELYNTSLGSVVSRADKSLHQTVGQ